MQFAFPVTCELRSPALRPRWGLRRRGLSGRGGSALAPPSELMPGAPRAEGGGVGGGAGPPLPVGQAAKRPVRGSAALPSNEARCKRAKARTSRRRPSPVCARGRPRGTAWERLHRTRADGRVGAEPRSGGRRLCPGLPASPGGVTGPQAEFWGPEGLRVAARRAGQGAQPLASRRRLRGPVPWPRPPVRARGDRPPRSSGLRAPAPGTQSRGPGRARARGARVRVGAAPARPRKPRASLPPGTQHTRRGPSTPHRASH